MARWNRPSHRFRRCFANRRFNEIRQNFSAEHLVLTVTFNFAGSQQLAQQLPGRASRCLCQR
jgi:hypothetical protein